MIKGHAESYRVFVRNWWVRAPDGTIIPGPGPQRTLARRMTFEEALSLARTWNAEHKPGPLSRKAEFTGE